MTLKLIVIIAFFVCIISSCSSSPPLKEERLASAEIIRFEFVPEAGTTRSKQKIFIGGFSALKFHGNKAGLLEFTTITDRGANASETKNGRVFLLPKFTPKKIDFSLNLVSRQLVINKISEFTDNYGKKILGLPPGLKNYTPAKLEKAVDEFRNPIKFSGLGMDSEGYCETQKNIFVSDEYGPTLFKFDTNMKLLKSWRPEHGLPNEYRLRKINRGFEGLACDERKLVLAFQSPLETEEPKDFKKIRLLEFDVKSEVMRREYFYPIEVADKLGDISFYGDNKVLVIEQNGKLGAEKGIRSIFKIDLTKSDSDGNLTKELVVDLNKIGLAQFEKIEGIAVVDLSTLALIVDNDFGLTGDYNESERKYIMKADADSYLIIIHLAKNLE